MKFLTPEYENQILQQGKYKRIIGIDEVGRGAWAGPVAVGAYIYDSNSIFVDGVNDSKKIPLKKRQLLFDTFRNDKYIIEYGEVDFIDKLGIGKTIEYLIQKIIEQYDSSDTLFLVDGRFSCEFKDNVICTIKGDSTYYSIAVASIMAKVDRDKKMDDLSQKYMYYGLDKNKGYGTKLHREGIVKYGICNEHRKSYKPISEIVKGKI